VENRPVDLVGAAEREEFLAATRVDVLSAAVGTAGGTLAVSAWYGCQPSGLRSRKAAAKDQPQASGQGS
jgi:hypothetical protein